MKFSNTYTHKNAQVTSLQTSCYKSVHMQPVDKLCSHCLFLVVVTSLEQAVNNLMALSDLLQGCSNKSDIQSRYNKNVTRLTTQGCNNIMTVSDLLEQPCDKSDNINKVVTSC